MVSISPPWVTMIFTRSKPRSLGLSNYLGAHPTDALPLAPRIRLTIDGRVFGQYHPVLPSRRPTGRCQQDRDGIVGSVDHFHRLRPPSQARRDHPRRIQPAGQRRTQAGAQHRSIRALLRTGQGGQRLRRSLCRVWESVVHAIQSRLVGRSDERRRCKPVDKYGNADRDVTLCWLFQTASGTLALSPTLNPGDHWDYQTVPIQLPPLVRLLLADVSAGSNTPSLVSKVLKWRREKADEGTQRSLLNMTTLTTKSPS